jgi:HPt (histidine-containing phosphotransfer) domain-containing protein
VRVETFVRVVQHFLDRAAAVGATPGRAVEPAAAEPMAGSGRDRLVSDFAADPVVGPLVPPFLAELRDKVDGILAALDGRDLAEVSRLAHQIKGAAGAYGFPAITQAAAATEAAARGAATSAPAAGDVRAPAQRLADLCDRAMQPA